MTDSLPALIRRLNAQGWLVKPPFAGNYFLVTQPSTGRVMAWSAADPAKALTEFQGIIDGTTRGWALHPAWKDTMVADDVSAQQEPVFGVAERALVVERQIFSVSEEMLRMGYDVVEKMFSEHGLSAALRRLGEAVDRMTEALS